MNPETEWLADFFFATMDEKACDTILIMAESRLKAIEKSAYENPFLPATLAEQMLEWLLETYKETKHDPR